MHQAVRVLGVDPLVVAIQNLNIVDSSLLLSHFVGVRAQSKENDASEQGEHHVCDVGNLAALVQVVELVGCEQLGSQEPRLVLATAAGDTVRNGRAANSEAVVALLREALVSARGRAHRRRIGNQVLEVASALLVNAQLNDLERHQFLQVEAVLGALEVALGESVLSDLGSSRGRCHDSNGGGSIASHRGGCSHGDLGNLVLRRRCASGEHGLNLNLAVVGNQLVIDGAVELIVIYTQDSALSPVGLAAATLFVEAVISRLGRGVVGQAGAGTAVVTTAVVVLVGVDGSLLPPELIKLEPVLVQ